MIKLFTPESFKDYIQQLQNGSSSSVVYDSGNISDALHDSVAYSGSEQFIDSMTFYGYSDQFKDSASELGPIGDISDGSDDNVSSGISDGSNDNLDDNTIGDGVNDGEFIDISDVRPQFNGNGDIILRPSSCKVEAEINGNWKLTLTHPYDREGRYTYLSKDAVIAIPLHIAREQQDTEQYFRIFQVKESQTGVDIVAYPVIYESIYESPIEYLQLENVDYLEMTTAVLNQVTKKYDIQYLDDLGTNKESLYIENSNLQEVVNGNQEGTITSLFESEVIYDNYIYRIGKKVGKEDTYKDYKITYSANLIGVTVDESTDEMVTRIYPMSDEGVTCGNGYHVDSVNIDKHPIAFAKSIKYNDIKLIDEKDEDDETPENEMQVATREVKAAVAAKVNELSLKYLQKARRGEWVREGIYQDKMITNKHCPGVTYSLLGVRNSLPYGYLFYSYTDAIGVLTEQVLDPEMGIISCQEERTLFEEAIKDGFKWCESTEIAGYDWHLHVDYDDPNYFFVQSFGWLQDDTGWWYGDGQGNYLTHCWIEDDINRHYWVGDDGYWQPQWDDHETWEWYQDSTGWWYGSKNSDGSTKNYAKTQYIRDSRNDNWFWFNDEGYFVDGDAKYWRYGTKDGKDIVTMQYWNVGGTTWWFDENGYISTTLAYAPNFEWREDAKGKYYGDGEGHWLSNCWVEDSDSKHRWIDQDGYYYGDDDETTNKYDGQQWTWHGNWGDGWWYGCNYEDDDEDDDDNNSSSSSSSDTSSGSTSSTSSLGSSLLPQFETIGELFSDKKSVSGMTTSDKQSLLAKGYTYIQNKGYLAKLKKKFTNVSSSFSSDLIDNLKDMGYTYDEDEDTLTLADTTSSPSGEDLDPEDKTGLKNYVWGQFMQVTSANKWYWFDENGYYVDCWMATDSWEWHNDSRGWWYGDGAGTYPQGQWMKIGGKWYFFDEEGYADETTDDFEDPKSGSYESATYDSNREGIKASSSTKTSDDETSYDAEREGVKAWIQDDFVNELLLTIVDQHDYLHKKLKENLTRAAQEDLKELDHPKYTLTVNFNTMVNTPGYSKFSYLKELYLGDTVTVDFSVGGITSIDRITAITYDVIKDDIESITIGKPEKTFIKNLANLTPRGNLKKWKPTYGLEDGYGGYLLTGFNGTNLTVE